jgi:hypothetical protein
MAGLGTSTHGLFASSHYARDRSVELILLFEELNLLTGEPQLLTREPQLLIGEPQLLIGEPQLLTGEPQLLTGEPKLLSRPLFTDPDHFRNAPAYFRSAPERRSTASPSKIGAPSHLAAPIFHTSARHFLATDDFPENHSRPFL